MTSIPIAAIESLDISEDRFLSAFEKLDRDHDKVLSSLDIDQAVIDPTIDSDLGEIVAALKAEFGEIKALHKEAWFSRKNGITLADILLFEEALRSHENHAAGTIDNAQAILHSKRHVTDPIVLGELARDVMTRVDEAANSERCLYKSKDNPLESVRPEAIRQGIVGDCYFLGALASVAASNPQIIVRIIKDNCDNTFTVTFPGARDEPVTINAPTVVELALYARLTEWGIWPAVLEKAYGAYIGHLIKNAKLIPAENTAAAEHMSESLQLLTGQAGRFKLLTEVSHEALTATLTRALKEKRAIGAATKANKTQFTDDAGLPSSHAYSIIAWDPSLSRITLRNPWGPVRKSEPELIGGHPADGILDGVFTMDLLHFLLNFDVIYFEDWAPDDNYIDPFEAPDGAIVERIKRTI
jgi:Calpain family cysteine protease